MTRLSDIQREQIRSAAMNAVSHVSDAEQEGFFARIKEGRAGTKALEALPEPLRDAVLGDYNTPDAYEFPADDTVQAYIRDGLTAVQTACPELLDQFKRVVMQACDEVAAAAKGVSDNERAALAEVRAALGL